MMEGISSEAASLAGHLKLSNVCWIYDNNKITIEGHTSLAFSEDVAAVHGLRLNVLRVSDANDLDMLNKAFEDFLETKDRPTLIIVDSHIAFGSPNKQDTHAPTASRSARKRSSSRRRTTAGRRTPSSSCRRACTSLPPGNRQARQGAARGLGEEVRGLQGEVPEGSL